TPSFLYGERSRIIAPPPTCLPRMIFLVRGSSHSTFSSIPGEDVVLTSIVSGAGTYTRYTPRLGSARQNLVLANSSCGRVADKSKALKNSAHIQWCGEP